MQLRRLVFKSVILFGRYRGKTVAQILAHKVGEDYIRWLYFNSSHIDLTPEVFAEAGIDPEHKIEKPGKSTELFDKHYSNKSNAMKNFLRIKTDHNAGANHMIKKKEILPKDQLKHLNRTK